MKQQFIQFINNPLVEKLAIIAVGVVITWLIIKTIQRRLLLIMVVFSNRLGGLTMALGVAGAGIAFALQEVIVSFAGWLTIMVGGFYKSGDRVQLGGIKGDVMDIGVLRTTIMETGQWVDGDLYNGRIVLIANSFVFKEPVFNYSGEFPFLWDEIKIPIQYGSDYDKVKEILLRAGKEVAGDLTTQSREQWHALQIKYRLEEAQTEPMVSLIANDNWVEFTLRFVVSYKKRRATKTELFTRILKEVDATNGAVKFASATFHLVDAPEIKVKIS
jgi:small-conductance mechanosensitive channel